MVYAVVSKTTSRKAVWVRLPPWAPVKILKIGFLILSVAYMLRRVFNPSNFDLLDYVNLAIHEAGHLIFYFFGEFISFTGGTFFQLLLPFLFVVYFLRKDLYSASIVSFWFAHSLINVSVYIKDAIMMQLPLLGGGMHDWNYILSKLNMLSFAPNLGSIVYFSGVLIIIVGSFSGFFSLIYKRRNLTI
jgi:hypothetical protein